jgi:hypothetical protein
MLPRDNFQDDEAKARHIEQYFQHFLSPEPRPVLPEIPMEGLAEYERAVAAVARAVAERDDLALKMAALRPYMEHIPERTVGEACALIEEDLWWYAQTRWCR